MIGYYIAAVIGAVIGWCLCSLCTVSSWSDRKSEELRRLMNENDESIGDAGSLE